MVEPRSSADAPYMLSPAIAVPPNAIEAARKRLNESSALLIVAIILAGSFSMLTILPDVVCSSCNYARDTKKALGYSPGSHMACHLHLGEAARHMCSLGYGRSPNPPDEMVIEKAGLAASAACAVAEFMEDETRASMRHMRPSRVTRVEVLMVGVEMGWKSMSIPSSSGRWPFGFQLGLCRAGRTIIGRPTDIMQVAMRSVTSLLRSIRERLGPVGHNLRRSLIG